MGNYILWGKDRNTGLNAKQDGSVQLSSRSGDWDADSKYESLDALLESPTFNEASLVQVDTPLLKNKKEVFSREDALAQCPEDMRPIFEDLFRQIDILDLKINYYDLLHGKRIKPPREDLVDKFDLTERNKF